MLDGNGGADTIIGYEGADRITYRGTEAELAAFYRGTLSGVGQNDTLVMLAAATVDLGNADQTSGDTVNVSAFQNADASALAVALNLTGDLYGNRLIGSSGVNTIAGNDGNDWIDGGAGLDTITGGNGNDTITLRGTAGTINGNADTDTLRVIGAATINLNNGDQTSGDTAAVSGFENVDGSASTVAFSAIGRNTFNSILIGGSAGDTLTAGASAAQITGNGGADILTGGASADSFYIYAGDVVAGESINGGSDNDVLYVRGTSDFTSATLSSLEVLHASATDANGNPVQQGMTITLTGAQAAGFSGIYANGSFLGSTVEAFVVNVASGTTVNLSTISFANFDSADTFTVIGAAGNETIIAPTFRSVVRGGGGNDTIKNASVGGYSAEGAQIFGEAGNDRIDYGYPLANITLDGGADDDTLVYTETIGTLDEINLALTTDQTIGDTPVVRNFEYIDWSASLYGIRVTGSSGLNSIIGSQGNDTIDGGAGFDRIDGQGGNDLITYRSTADTIGGGGDTDTLRVLGAATINLNNFDQSSGDGAVVNSFENVDGTASTVSITAIGSNAQASKLYGGSAADTLTAGAGGSDIIGGGGADTLTGGTVQDNFFIRSGDFAAGESINGGDGGDQLLVGATTDFTVGTLANLETLYASAQDRNGNYLQQGVTVTLTGTQAAGFSAIYANVLFGGLTAETFIINVASGTTINLSAVGWGYNDSLDSVTINGAAGNETIVGANVASVVRGNGGSDTLKAPNSGYWADGTQVFGDAGSDRIDYGTADYNVTLDGGANSDTLVYSYAFGNVDVINLTSAADQTSGDTPIVRNFENLDWSTSSLGLVATGTSGANSIIGSQGADTIDGSAGLDTIDGQAGNDLITYRSAASTIGGGAEIDTLRVLGAATINLNNADQTSGDTTVVTGFEKVDGSASTATVVATGSDNQFSVLIGGSAGDTLTAGSFYGADITGNGGADTLIGGTGVDYFFVFAGDVVAGETINGGLNTDTLYVRGSNDLTSATLSNLETLYAIAADAAGNLLVQNVVVTLTGAQVTGFSFISANPFFATTAETFIVNVASGTTTDLSAISWTNFDTNGNDTLTVNGAAGNETITGASVASVIRGNGGNDTLRAPSPSWAANSSVFGDAGNDRIDYGNPGNSVIIDGGADNDTLVFTTPYFSPDTIDLTAADQTIGDLSTVANFENLDWSASNNGLSAIGSSSDNIIIGSMASDTIAGGEGNDTIEGGRGDDTMTGGGGNDVFVFTTRTFSNDRITDFLASADDLRFAASAFAIAGTAFDQRLATGSTGIDITDKDLVIYTGAALDSVGDVQNYLRNAAGGSFLQGVFIVGQDSSNRTVLYHATDASFLITEDVVKVAELGTLTAPTAIQLADFIFV